MRNRDNRWRMAEKCARRADEENGDHLLTDRFDTPTSLYEKLRRTPMLNRREFLSAAAVGAATFARGPRTDAARYDMIIRGGRVIDPSVRLDADRDVAISGGRIAAIEVTIAGEAAEAMAAHGKLVVPGRLELP